MGIPASTRRPSMLVRSALAAICWLFLLRPSLADPETANIGTAITVTVTGITNPRDFISIVAKGSPERQYDAYEYADKSGKVQLRTPATPGDYEIRLLAANSPYETLARTPL